jgi:hypothetical protein
VIQKRRETLDKKGDKESEEIETGISTQNKTRNRDWNHLDLIVF